MKKTTIYLFSLLLILVAGCTKDFEKMNTDPNAVTKVEPAYFFSGMVQQVFANYQRNVNLYPDFYSQYFANTVQSFGSPRYEYVDGWIGNQWKEHYTEFLRKSNAIQDQYKDDASFQEQLAIAEIFTCYWWSRMTDTYGDIPYFGAGLGETVPYTSQEEIYKDLFARLEVAVNKLPMGDNQVKYGQYDRIYNGDAAKWKKFGNSLRLRLAMRISNIDPATAASVAQSAVSSGVMTSNDDVAKVPMWASGWYDYLHQMLWNWDNARVSKTFTNYLYSESTAGEDPRAPYWLTYKRDGAAASRESLGLEEYVGLENGYGTNMPSDANDKATINLYGSYVDFSGNGADAMYCPVMFYSEVLFLQAEAALRGWVPGDANALYKAGIQASMDYVGVDASAAQQYIDGVADLSGSDEARLKKIITQKWIANFPNGVEGWADFRRTDYPDLTLPIDGVSGNASVAQGTFVKRVRYPNNQHDLNSSSMPASLNTLDKDRMDVKVWWDVEGTESKGADGLMNSNFR